MFLVVLSKIQAVSLGCDCTMRYSFQSSCLWWLVLLDWQNLLKSKSRKRMKKSERFSAFINFVFLIFAIFEFFKLVYS